MSAPVGIVGLGLIGGSLALALKRAQPALRLIGVDADAETRRLALEAGAVDLALGLDQAPLGECGLVVLAVPGPALLALLEPVAQRLGPDAALTDVGGAKEPVCAAGGRQDAAVFVGGHPMAGTEFRGFRAARADLFTGCTVALCKPRGGRPGAAEGPAGTRALDEVRALWRAAGAGKLLDVEPEEHDHAVTFASHLPYLAAAATAEALLVAGPFARLARELAAGGFRDTTRLAGDGTLAGAASQNRFLPAAARALARVLEEWAGRLERDPAALVEQLGRLADERRAMPLPPPVPRR